MPYTENAFFTLPIELHTQIFSLACSPSSCSSALSYYTAFYTGLALSLVSKYVHAASAPVRHQAVALYSWNEMVAFERTISSRRCNSRVRYLSIICDELPRDPVLLQLEDAATTPQSLELTLLNVIKKILYAVSDGLYELEIGFQVIERIKDPLAYLSLSGPLFFPCLEAMFYACPPSNACPWVANSSIPSSMRTSTMCPIICPRLKDLTVVCASFESVANFVIRSAGEMDNDIQEVNAAVTSTPIRSGDPRDERTGYKDSRSSDVIDSQFPLLNSLTILASAPEQALAVLDANGRTWDVGSPFSIDLTVSRQACTSTSIGNSWPPRSLRTVIVRPKSHWNERWDSLRDVMKRQGENGDVDIVVVKPGELYY